ncbi:MAG: acetyl-CoA decarbonylase/synthase complex subunit delta [Vulcanimicrobiota bacterium]
MSLTTIRKKQNIETVTIGATAEEGGTRSHHIKIGGQGTMPFLYSEGEIPYLPVVAYEFQDIPPDERNPYLIEELEKAWNNPVSWAKYLMGKTRAKLLCLRLMGAHPSYGNKTKDEIKETVKKILSAVTLPLIIIGCGIQEVDADIMPMVAEVCRGERILMGNAVAESYKKMTKACIEHGHNLITESPIDINIAKQVNILATDAGLPPDSIVMYATTGALGYGLEYAYSIMEKTRLLGLDGDKFMNKPQLAFIGQETWRVKEAQASLEAAINWEIVTSLAYLHAGADVVVVKHPETGNRLEKFFNNLRK